MEAQKQPLTYTREEFRKLLSMAESDEHSMIPFGIKLLTMYPIDLRKIDDMEYMEGHIAQNCGTYVAKVMFRMRLDEMPLHTADLGRDVVLVARWRLEMGK